MASGDPLLVLENIRIAGKKVGLLDGKSNRSALEMETMLSPEPGESSFKLAGRPVRVHDRGHHFFLRLEQPKPLKENESAISLQKDEGGVLRAEEVKCVLSQMRNGSYGVEPALTLEGSSAYFLNTSDKSDTSDASESEKESVTWSWLLDKELPDLKSDMAQQEEKSRESIVNSFFANVKEPTLKEVQMVHRNQGHTSNTEMISLLERKGVDRKMIDILVESIDCAWYKNRAFHRTPFRPKVGELRWQKPGQSIHFFCSHFEHPEFGNFSAILGADAFSDRAYGDAIDGQTGIEIAQVYVNRVDEEYESVTYHLAGFAHGIDFVNFMGRFGIEVVFVPTEAHWGRAAENLIHRTRVELDAVFYEFPELGPRSAVQLALKRINGRIMKQYGLSRMEVHRGRKRRDLNAVEGVMKSALFPLSPKWHLVEKIRVGAIENVAEHDKKKIGLNFARALESKPVESVDLYHGDKFQFWRKGKKKIDGDYLGPAFCIGVCRAEVIGWYAGSAIAAHITRVQKISDGIERYQECIDPAKLVLPDTNIGRQMQQPLEREELNHEINPSDPLEVTDSSFEKDAKDFLCSLPPADEMDVVDDLETIIMPQPLEKIDENVEEYLLSSLPKPDDEDPEKFLMPQRDVLDPEEVIDGKLRSKAEVSDDAEDILEKAMASQREPILAAEPEIQKGDPVVIIISPRKDDAGQSSLPDAQINARDPEDVMKLPEHQKGYPDLVFPILPDADVESMMNDGDFYAKKSSEGKTRKREKESEDCVGSSGADMLSKLREIAESSRNGEEYPAQEDPADEELKTPLAQRRYHKKLRSQMRKENKKWHDDDESFNAIFSQNYGMKLPEDLGATTAFYFQQSKEGPVIRRTNLVNKQKARTVVLDYEDAVKNLLMREAMEDEMKSFQTMDCAEEVELSKLGTEGNKISTKLVMTLKTREDGTKECKARLVARGFEDVERGIITRDSPVASNAFQRMVLLACVENQFRVNNWDSKNAFLQGRLISRDNPVYVMPPSGFGVKEGHVWKLKKPIFGLSSAPKAWYDRLVEVITEAGLDSKVSDEVVLRMLNKGGNVIEILALHVDDTIGGGMKEFPLAMKKVSESLEVGAFEEDNFHYKGLRVTTSWDEGVFSVSLDGDEYLDSAIPMVVLQGKDDAKLDLLDATNFRSVADCIGYYASAFRSELSLECSYLGRKFVEPTIGDAKMANAILLWAQENRYVLMFRKGFADMLSVFCDSAGPDERGTQEGRLMAMTDLDSHFVGGWLFWDSRKVKRVCKAKITREKCRQAKGMKPLRSYSKFGLG